MSQKVTPCLWFDGQAEQAARYYVSLLPDSRIDRVVRSAADTPSGPAGMVLLVEFTLAGNTFTGLNGGPRATRAAKLKPGVLVPAEVIQNLPRLDVTRMPRVRDCLP